MRVTRLRGLPVLDTGAARQAGIVSDVILDPVAGRLAAIDVVHGDGFLQSRVPADQVVRLDRNRVLVRDTNEVEFLAPQEWDPGLVGLKALVGLRVLTDQGEPVGKLKDADIHPADLTVNVYHLTALPFIALLPRLRVRWDDVVSCSPEVMVVRRRPGQKVVATAPAEENA